MGRLTDKLKLSGRRTELLVGAGMVLALVAVIFIFSALGSPGDISGPSDAATPQLEAQQLALDAGQALSSGDTTLAATLAQKALSLDPGNQSAAAVLEQAQSRSDDGSSDADDGGDSGTEGSTQEPGDPAAEPEVDDSAFEADIDDLGALLPATFPEFSLGDVSVVDLDAQVSGTAVKLSNPARQITWAVHGFANPSAAKAFIDDTSKQFYGSGGESVKIDGASGYFGTDGTRYATAVYVRGKYVFEVLVSGDVDPAGHKTVAVAAAKAFSDTAK